MSNKQFFLKFLAEDVLIRTAGIVLNLLIATVFSNFYADRAIYFFVIAAAFGMFLIVDGFLLMRKLYKRLNGQ